MAGSTSSKKKRVGYLRLPGEGQFPSTSNNIRGEPVTDFVGSLLSCTSTPVKEEEARVDIRMTGCMTDGQVKRNMGRRMHSMRKIINRFGLSENPVELV